MRKWEWGRRKVEVGMGKVEFGSGNMEWGMRNDRAESIEHRAWGRED